MSSSLNPPNADLALMAQAAQGKPEFAAAFRRLAASYWRARDAQAYAWCSRQAFLLDPSENSAGMPMTDASAEAAADTRDRINALLAHGAGHSRAIAALVLAEASLGNGDAVRRLMDYDRLLHRGSIASPPGMTLAKFNAMLADEIKSDLQFHDASESHAIRRAWRFEGVRDGTTPAVRKLKDILRRHVQRYIDALPDDPDHPINRTRPAGFEISGWAVVSNAESHHVSHIHPAAWLTGVYYVVQPEVSRTSHRGWLRVGPPNRSPALWDSTLVAPEPGGFVLMPGYFWHDTEPMGVDQERICIAFEAQPSELRASGRRASRRK